MDRFDSISPLDYRYYAGSRDLFEGINRYLSEKASIRYRLMVEDALVRVLAERGICPKEAAAEISRACADVSVEEVYREEERVRHDIRALVNCVRKRVSEKARPFVHLTATSSDIVCTADSLRLKEASENLLVPVLLELEKTLIAVARREKGTLQIGRTHGQHAEPITFGFAMSEYVSRLGNSIVLVRSAASGLRGKMSGAVGNYNASSLFFTNPEEFEAAVLGRLGLKPASHSTQIVEPEFAANFMHSAVVAFGVLANLSDDMRHLQRSEIAEVAEEFVPGQVGSSTMPHKRNPINFENVKSMWKAFMPRMTTLYLDQVSEHQRDLTNSASSRFAVEIIAALVLSAARLCKVMSRVVVDTASLKRNLERSKDFISAEPAYILLASLGHPDAHEFVRKLTLQAQAENRKFIGLLIGSDEARPYLEKLSPQQLEVLKSPEKYTGIAASKTEKVCSYWEAVLGL